jgi:hypothetical protein
MAHFANVESGIVTQVIVAEPECFLRVVFSRACIIGKESLCGVQ